MIILCTDFGRCPYTGQMQAVLQQQASGVPVISLFDDLPSWDIRAAAYLLPAFVNEFPLDSVFVVVVDPGVGSEQRLPVIARLDGRWFVGPGNGVLHILARRASQARFWRIDWRPERLSASFHGRDLFAPVAARLALGEAPEGESIDEPRPVGLWPDDLAQILYIDHFGNAITGLRVSCVETSSRIQVGAQVLSRARTFADVGVGQAFWYENANGLVEIAVNCGRADRLPGIIPGGTVDIL
ncbi:SAM hydrolase/SAM-dependent halogenase family protein [Sulfuriflexus mobilis]|uniref:SAM hydrolase/SAM-dependent halogenase family protein n=1 Tax=Sulfuriflexus mobilis TaxID=1811807 RepID=UPI000F83ED6C|nr:SAM-dependent chlorinase/fluorinase [Sulfuriflexus mobilis]